MRALHVVSVYLELGLCVGRRVVGEEQVLVCLLRVGFLRGLANQNPPVKNAFRATIQYSIVILMAVAVWLRMFHHHVVISQLIFAREVKSIEDAFDSFPIE